MKKLLGWTIVGMSLLATAGDGARAQEQRLPGRLLDETVAVSLVRWTTDADGAKRQTGSADVTLPVKGSGNIYSSSGFIGADGVAVDPLCNRSIGAGGDREKLRDEAAHLWWVDVAVVDATTEKIELAIDWSRFDRDAGNAPVRGGERTITLQEGQAHVIDFLERAPGSDSDNRCGLNVVYELQAEVVEDAELADQRMTYFIFTIDQETGKPRKLQTSYAYGGQGEEVEVERVSFRWPLERTTPAGLAGEVVADFDASVRGRVRPDGTIDLHLGAERQVGVARVGEPRRGGVGGGGRRMFNIKPGELIELVMPTPQGAHTELIDPSGSYGQISTTAPTDDGVAVSEHAMRVDFGSFFSNHRMSIFVTATLGDQSDPAFQRPAAKKD